MHLEKLAAAARIASACMSGWPEEPASPLQSSLPGGASGAGWAPNSLKDPPGIRPGGRGDVEKRSSWLWPRAAPMEPESERARTPNASPAAPTMLEKCLPAVLGSLRDPKTFSDASLRAALGAAPSAQPPH